MTLIWVSMTVTIYHRRLNIDYWPVIWYISCTSSWSLVLLFIIHNLWNCFWKILTCIYIFLGFSGGSIVKTACKRKRWRRCEFNSGVRRSSGDRHSNPLHYSCLGNPMYRGAWQATQVSKSWTLMSACVHTHTCTRACTPLYPQKLKQISEGLKEKLTHIILKKCCFNTFQSMEYK